MRSQKAYDEGGSKLKKPKKPSKFMRREYGIGDFLDHMHADGGMKRAVRRVRYEDRQEKLFKEMDSKGQVKQ